MLGTVSRQGVIALALLLLGLGLPPLAAQEPLPPPPLPHASQRVTLPPPPPLPPSAPQATPPLPFDTLLDAPGTPPGWYGAIELGLVKPHVKNRLVGVVSFPQFPLTDVIHLPGAALDWTVAPRFELGYRLPEGLGEFLVSYRFLVSDGREFLPDFDFLGDGILRSRLDLNVWDFDYASREIALGSRWDMKWRVGARLANVFLDSRGDGQFLGQRTSNRFVGAGPHLGLDLNRRLYGPGFSLFARTEGALVLGRVRQGFEEIFFFDDGTAIGSASTVCASQSVPTMNVQFGLGWTPLGDAGLNLTLGYQYEHWWAVGNAGDSRGELWDQGLFFRGELRY